jgi:hypothetical protein
MSTIKVNTVTKRTGSTLTIGECGATVQLATGATQTGFGRTGTVDWCTTAKTSPFTAVSGDGYFVNTTSGAVTVTLPASPSAGDIVAISDYASTFQTNSVTIARNSSKINGACTNAVLETEGVAVTLVYVDGTRGWKQVNDATENVTGAPNYVVATGGDTTITNGDFKIHAFTSDGTLCVSNAGNPCGSTVLEYLVVGGGGSGGKGDGAGGGAGGFRYFSALSPAGSPLVAPAGITASVSSFPITVGGGGAGVPVGIGNAGSNTIFSTITSAGGGGGGSGPLCKTSAQNGGSGGGGVASRGAGCGNTPAVSPPQGQNGTSGPSQGGGGGGAGGVGGPSPGTTGGKGGLGSYIPDGFFGPTAPSYGTSGPESSTRYFAGGAGGHGDSARGPAPDGGGGGQGDVAPGGGRTAGTANTGGGGGGGQPTPTSAAGGSGVVFIRYKFQN